jgi:hypothetical protein
MMYRQHQSSQVTDEPRPPRRANLGAQIGVDGLLEHEAVEVQVIGDQNLTTVRTPRTAASLSTLPGVIERGLVAPPPGWVMY